MSELTICKVSVRFGSVTAVHDVSLTLREGEVVGLIGLNGAGKSTLIDAITGFVPYSGSVVLDGYGSLDRARPHIRARLGVVRTWQAVELFDELTVQENVWLAMDELDLRSVGRAVLTGGSARPPTAVHDALELFGIGALAPRRPAEISTGQRRLVGLARAIVGNARFILMDEPAAGLSASEREVLSSELQHVAKRGIGVMLVEHDTALVVRSCTMLHVMHLGELLASGPTAEVRARPEVIGVYLGDPVAGTGKERAT